MRIRSYMMILAVLIASGVAATSQQKQGEMPKGKMAHHQPGMMDMSAMKQEPHHVLAMAYKDNLVNFAKALHHDGLAFLQASGGNQRVVQGVEPDRQRRRGLEIHAVGHVHGTAPR